MVRLNTKDRQNMIIDEAIKIIHKGGYQSLSIREIAEKVKISESAIYRHFLNKEDIILGILNRMIDFDYLLEKDLAAKKSAKSKILRFMQFHFEFLEKNYEMTSVIFSEEIFNQSDILANRLKVVIKKRKDILTSIIEEARATNEIIDLENDELITIMLGVIRIRVLEWRLSNFNFSLSEKGKKYVKTIERLFFPN